MNKRQRIIIGIGLIFIVVMGLFPPWTLNIRGLSIPKGCSFILSPPHKLAGVNASRLLIEWVGVCVVAGGLILIFRKEKKDEQSIKGDKKCPHCGLINPISSQKCDCGYDFASDRNELIELVGSSSTFAYEVIDLDDISLDNETKKCPACAEIIKLEATKCRFCREEFDPEDVVKEVKDRKAELTKKLTEEVEKEEQKEREREEQKKGKSKKQCPQCGNWEVRWAATEDGGMGDWCPHCQKSLKAIAEARSKEGGEEKEGKKRCPQCDNWDVRWATIEDGGMGDWCPHCQNSFKAMGIVAPDSPVPKGIGGWLILPFLSLIVTIIRIPIETAITFGPIISEGQWALITSHASTMYNPTLASILVFEIAGNILITIYAIFIFILFIKHSRRLPKLIIAFYLLSLVFVLLDYVLITAIVNVPGDAETLREIFRSIVGCAVWIPYFLMSKRVKATFVK